LADNKIYTAPGVHVGFACGVNGSKAILSLEQWQALGLDIVTIVQTIIQWGREMLKAAA